MPTLPNEPVPATLTVRPAAEMVRVPLKLVLLPVKVSVVPLAMLTTNPPAAVLVNVPAYVLELVPIVVNTFAPKLMLAALELPVRRYMVRPAPLTPDMSKIPVLLIATEDGLPKAPEPVKAKVPALIVTTPPLPSLPVNVHVPASVLVNSTLLPEATPLKVPPTVPPNVNVAALAGLPTPPVRLMLPPLPMTELLLPKAMLPA